VTADPLGPAAEAFDEGVRRLRRAGETSRTGWNDEARQAYDAEFAEPIESESKAASAALERVRQDLRRALTMLD